MTLLEMSAHYSADAEAFSQRIRTLRRLMAQEKNAARRRQLDRRIKELQPLLQQSRALSRLTAHYYDRGAKKYEQYQL